MTQALDTQKDPHYRYAVEVVRTRIEKAIVEIVCADDANATQLAALEADRIGAWSPTTVNVSHTGLARGERVRVESYAARDAT